MYLEIEVAALENELYTDDDIEELDEVESELQTVKEFDYKELGVLIFFIHSRRTPPSRKC